MLHQSTRLSLDVVLASLLLTCTNHDPAPPRCNTRSAENGTTALPCAIKTLPENEFAGSCDDVASKAVVGVYDGTSTRPLYAGVTSFEWRIFVPDSAINRINRNNQLCAHLAKGAQVQLGLIPTPYALQWKPDSDDPCLQDKAVSWNQSVTNHECKHVADSLAYNSAQPTMLALPSDLDVCPSNGQKFNEAIVQSVANALSDVIAAREKALKQLGDDFDNSPEGKLQLPECSKCPAPCIADWTGYVRWTITYELKYTDSDSYLQSGELLSEDSGGLILDTGRYSFNYIATNDVHDDPLPPNQCPVEAHEYYYGAGSDYVTTRVEVAGNNSVKIIFGSSEPVHGNGINYTMICDSLVRREIGDIPSRTPDFEHIFPLDTSGQHGSGTLSFTDEIGIMYDFEFDLKRRR